ncbi:MAG: hypothetical protein RB191_23255 [Terriglobia bacterium]|nr:hypothetical protein [Terriglobia bacterium]
MLMYRQATTTPAEEEVTQAVRRVLERYGGDLAAYFRHVQEMARKNAQQGSDAKDSARHKSDDESSAQL